jgi:subtilisin family serine protease
LVVGGLGVAAVVAASSVGAAPRFTAGTPLKATSTYSAAKSSSGQLAQTDPALLGRTDATPVNVMIKYDFDASASYTGGVAGLAPTSPRVTGKTLRANSAAVAAYDRFTAGRTQAINARIQQALSGVKIRAAYRTVYGGVAARVPANEIGQLLRVPGVAAVQEDNLNQPQDDNTSFVGATSVWPSLGGSGTAGSNVTVGVIDTGVWPEHPMLADNGLNAVAGSRHCDFGDGSDAAHVGPAFSCNNKLIGAYAFLSTYMAVHGSDGHEFCNDSTGVCSARDSEGHGTHTTTTAAGDCVTSAVMYGVERGPVCGIAPGAHVIMYRVCMSQGCFSSDSVAAVQQAIADGVNVINFSISGGASPYSDPVELAFLDAVNAGISVNASAGNSGPGAGTSDHGGPWVTTVGASTGPRFFTSTLHLTADGGATFDMPGVTVTNGISSATPVILAQDIPGEDARCQTTLTAGSAAAGKIVLCQRGTNARVDKGFNVYSGGAAGMILYNPVKQDVETDNHWLPTIHVDGPAVDLLAFLSTHTNIQATWDQGQPTATQPDVMASFSSRGPTGDWIKPDVTAPGIQVLAGMTPQPDSTTPTNGPAGNLYQAIAGTSMSSPHAAGVSALVKAAHPTWTPAEIKSALMTSSVQDVVREDGVTPATPFDDGAGSIRANRAVSPTLVFDESYADFVAAGSDTLHRIDLNIPSIDATTMSGVIRTQRTALNVSGHKQRFTVEVSAPDGATITVGKNNNPLKVAKGGELTFPVTIEAPELPNGQYFGWIRLVPQSGANAVFLPVAFFKKQGAVTLTNTCSSSTIAAGASTSCSASAANTSTSTANVNLTIAPVPGRGLHYANATAPAAVFGNGDGVHWSGSLSPVVAPQIASFAPGSSPAGGYLPLSLFGITPIAGVGDDTITNFNTPTFYYGGEPYSSLGVVSNGYVVIGGGTSQDVVSLPQTFPNTARPNNVVAPFMTDLNPAAAGAVRIGTLTDGSTTWLVVDWEAVRNFSNTTAHSFEIWVRLPGGPAGTGPSSEDVSIAYGSNGAGDPGSGSNWGAENRDGTSGANLASQPANGSQYQVHTTPPAAGGQVSFTFDIKAARKSAGLFDSVAELTSDLTPGITQVVQPITVTP